MTDIEIPRDRYGRPLIIPPNGGKPKPYTRVSTLAKTLDDLNNLMSWKCRKVAEGLIRRPDLLTRVSGVIANGNPDEDWKVKKELNGICSEATEAAASSKGANAGTGLHALTEAIDRGEEPAFVMPEDAKRLDAYREATAELTPMSIEKFVVCDELEAAGTYDRVYSVPAGFKASNGYVFERETLVCGDVKTGRHENKYPLATSIQLAIYANSERYDPVTGDRDPIHGGVDLNVGLLIHMPPSGGCQVIPLDIAQGWELADVAADVREIRKLKAADIICG